MSQKNHYFSGAIYCLMATLSWGVMFPVMTHALKIADPFTFTCLRYTIAGIFFLLFLYYKEGKSAFKLDGNLFLLWLFGSAGFAGFGFLVFLGQKIAGPQGALSASMMMATMPMLGLLLTWGLKKIKPAPFSFVFILMSFLGVLLVISKGHLAQIFTAPSNYLANLFMLGGALCWVLYTIGATYFSQWSPIKYTALSTLFGLPSIYVITGSLLFSGSIEMPTFSTIIDFSPELLYMVLVAGFIGVLCWNSGNKIITSINGVLFMDVVPITAFAISILSGIVPTKSQILGVFFTATALVLNNLYQRRRLYLMKTASLTLVKP